MSNRPTPRTQLITQKRATMLYRYRRADNAIWKLPNHMSPILLCVHLHSPVVLVYALPCLRARGSYVTNRNPTNHMPPTAILRRGGRAHLYVKGSTTDRRAAASHWILPNSAWRWESMTVCDRGGFSERCVFGIRRSAMRSVNRGTLATIRETPSTFYTRLMCK